MFRPKMSDIMKDLAQMAFSDIRAIPSSEAMHAALLFAHVAWNRSLGKDQPKYKDVLSIFLQSNPDMWSELRSRNPEALIKIMAKEKEKRYATDRQLVVVCGMRANNVHVEWCEEKDYDQALEVAASRLESQYGPAQILGKGNH